MDGVSILEYDSPKWHIDKNQGLISDLILEYHGIKTIGLSWEEAEQLCRSAGISRFVYHGDNRPCHQKTRAITLEYDTKRVHFYKEIGRKPLGLSQRMNRFLFSDNFVDIIHKFFDNWIFGCLNKTVKQFHFER